MSGPSTVLSRYGTVQVTTSTPGQLLVMMYDGLFRFLGEAVVAMRANDRARSGERISRSHSILEMLASTLEPEHAPELCENLLALYMFCMSRLVNANIQQSPERIEEVMRVLSPLRDAWKEAVVKAPPPKRASVSG
jgi:flagellar protein FliS